MPWPMDAPAMLSGGTVHATKKLHGMVFVLALWASVMGFAPPPSSWLSPNRPPAQQHEQILDSKLERFQAALDSLKQDKRIPGLSVAVLKDQEVLLARGFGYADLEQSIPATENTVYRIASVTKPVSATLAMKLVEEGLLDLDEEMAAVPGFAEFCHSFKTESHSIFARDYTCNTERLTLRHHLSHTVDGPAGKQFRYNPVAFSWTSRVMAYRTGKPFSELVREYILEPVGMTSSARMHRNLPLPSDLAHRLAKPYKVNEAGEIVPSSEPPPQGDGAAGGIASTVSDLAKFDIALDGNQIVSQASRELMFQSSLSTMGGALLPYGLGWYVQDYEGTRLLWHSGWWEQAYSSLYLKVPEKGLTLILLANSEGLWWGNPLTGAEVQVSPFAAAFMDTFF